MLRRLRQGVRQYLEERLQVPSIDSALRRIRNSGYHPQVIGDVGAYRGDFARDCLALWPEAEVVCFEPQPHMAGQLAELCGTFPGRIKVHQCLLGAKRKDTVPFHVAETASSVLEEHCQEHTTIACPMETLDALAARGELPPVQFLKLDVQGYELEVLQGGELCLNDSVDTILTEISLLDIHRGVPLLADLVGWLHERRFVAFDLCGLTRRPLDQALWQIDMIFVRPDSPLRSDKRWQAESVS